MDDRRLEAAPSPGRSRSPPGRPTPRTAIERPSPIRMPSSWWSARLAWRCSRPGPSAPANVSFKPWKKRVHASSTGSSSSTLSSRASASTRRAVVAIPHRGRELPGRDLRLHTVTVPGRTALEQQLGEAKPVGLPEPEEEVSRPAEQPHRGAWIRGRRPLQSRADVLVVVVELIHEPLRAGRQPLLARNVAERREVAQMAFPGSVQLVGVDAAARRRTRARSRAAGTSFFPAGSPSTATSDLSTRRASTSSESPGATDAAASASNPPTNTARLRKASCSVGSRS